MLDWILRFVTRRASAVAIAGLVLGAVGTHYTNRLYRNLRPDLQELLPTEERSVIDLNEIARRLRSIDSLTVLLFSSDTQASRRFVDDLVLVLRDTPAEILAGVEYRISDELRFFNQRRALYMDLDDLKKIRKYVSDRIDYETNIRNPLNIFSDIEIPIPRLDFGNLRQEYQARVQNFTRFPGGYYATPDGTKRAILVNAPGRTTDIAMARRLHRAVDEAIARLNPRSYAPDLRVAFTGSIQNIIEEQEALVEDLIHSSVVVGVIVLLGMFLYFRSVRATFALFASVAIATVLTFTAAYFLIGYLNANSAFLGSIVIGNGINFGIIFLARALELRRANHSIDTSIHQAGRFTATATWTAALAAGLSYGSLVITDFRGFRQFGIIGLIGMLLCWVSAFTILPALLHLLNGKEEPRLRLAPTGPPGAPSGERLFARFVAYSAYPLSILTLLLSAGALLTWPKYSPEVLEANLAKLRSKRSMEKGSAYYARFQDEIFQRYLSPTVILPQTRAQTREIARRLKGHAAGDAAQLVASVQTLDDFIPKDQFEKIRVLSEIRTLLPERLLKKVPATDQKLARELLATPLHPIRERDLPPLILGKFTEKNGRIGNLILVEPPLGEEIRKRENLLKFVSLLRDTADSIAPGAPVAGTLPVSADTLASIARDGPQATLLSLIAVVLLVTLLFRKPMIVFSVLFTLGLGVLWLSGLILGLGLKINFLNFIALPLTFGLGVDYGVNVFQRYLQEGRGGMPRAVQKTGGAVALCAFTTTTGYGSLLLAQNLAFVSFGELAVLGTLTCVTAALVSMPAYRILRDRRLARQAAKDAAAEPPLRRTG